VVFNYIFYNGYAHIKNFSLIRNDSGELELSPAYDLMSTIIHTPGESDTALHLFENDHESADYATSGHYCRSEFVALAQKLGIVEVRYLRIIDGFLEKKAETSEFNIEDFEKRILEFYNVVKPGGRGFITFNAMRMVENTSAQDLQTLFSSNSPTPEQLTQYVKTVLNNLTINFLLVEVLINDCVDEIINGNIRLIFEK
jgi:hypothetical protein